MNFRKYTKHIVLVASLIAMAALFSRCSKSDGDAADGGSGVSSAITISGSLSGVSGASISSKTGHKKVSAMATIDLANLKIYAIALSSPPAIAEADVGADGAFSVTLAGAKGFSISAIFQDKTDNSQVGMIIFEDTSKTDMNGNPKQSTSVALNGSVSLGTLTMGSDGKVIVPISQIASSTASSGSVAAGIAYDPTGTWYINSVTHTLPTGFQTAAPCGQGGHSSDGGGGGDGPCIGFPITMFRMAGKEFNPNQGQCDKNATPIVCAESSGTVTSADRYALSIWGGSYIQGIGACGNRTGFTQAEVRANAGLHVAASSLTVEGNTVNWGAYIYTIPSGFGGTGEAPYNQTWMKTGAVASYPIENCRPHTITNGGATYEAWACRAPIQTGDWNSPSFSGGHGWSVGIQGGGCKDSTGKPINVNFDTAGMFPDSCADTDAAATYGAGFRGNTCTYTGKNHDGDGVTAAVSFSCEQVLGQFADSSGAPGTTPLGLTGGQYLGQPTTLLAQDDLCSSVGSATDAAILAGFRCYADSYWQDYDAATANASCAREYDFDWSATTPADFVSGSAQGKPNMAFITSILDYGTDGQSATLEDVETITFTLSTGPNSSTACEASRTMTLTFNKQSDGRLYVNMGSKGQMNSIDEACVAAAKDALAGKHIAGAGELMYMLQPDNMVFYLQKTAP